LNKLPEPISVASLSKEQLQKYQEQVKREKEAREKAEREQAEREKASKKVLDEMIEQEGATSEAKTENQGDKPADSKTKAEAPEAEPSEEKTRASDERSSEAKTKDGHLSTEVKTKEEGETSSETKNEGQEETPSQAKNGKNLGENLDKEKSEIEGQNPKMDTDKKNNTTIKKEPRIKVVCKKSSSKRREELLQGLLKGVDKKGSVSLLDILIMHCVEMLNGYRFVVIQEVLKVCLIERKAYKDACEELVYTLVRALSNEKIMDHPEGHRAFKILVKNVPELAIALAQKVSTEALVSLLSLRGVYILAPMLDLPQSRKVLIKKLKDPAVVSAMTENEGKKGVALIQKLMEETSS